jgi:Gas vesicle synthesis protein GvpL/GvpF
VGAVSAKYVYGIVDATTRVPARGGIDDAPLALVDSGRVAALVSDVAGELRMGRDAMTAHARVLEETHALGTVLPMRFGVVMQDGDAVRSDLLDVHREELTRQLAEFAGKVELKLRAMYEEETLLREVVRDDRDVAELRAGLRGQSEDATYYARIRLGELIAKAIERKRAVDAEQILAALSPLALAVEVAEPSHERIALGASFLVEEAALEQFDAAVDRIGEAQAGRMRLRYTGPLPPHSFVHFATEA